MHLVKPVDPDRLARVIDTLSPRGELAGVRS
jgi:two-component SAPR family response regulator